MIYLALFDWWKNVPPGLEFVILLATFVTAVVGLRVKVFKPLKNFGVKANRGLDVIVGGTVTHYNPKTGQEETFILPPLAQRVGSLEESNEEMVKTHKEVADALIIIAENQKTVLALQQELREQRLEMENRRIIGEQIVEEYKRWQAEVNRKLSLWVSEQDELGTLIKGEIAKEDESKDS